MDDTRIIRLLFDRAEGAISALSKRFGKRLQTIAMNILADPRDAEECVSDTYLALWDAIPPLIPQCLEAYAARTVRNIAIRRLRHRTAAKRGASSYEVSLEELAGCLGSDSLEQVLDQRALGQAMDDFLDTLSGENRVIFLRRHWYGDSVEQIARDVGLGQNAVSARLSRIRGKLKEYLQEEGFSL